MTVGVYEQEVLVSISHVWATIPATVDEIAASPSAALFTMIHGSAGIKECLFGSFHVVQSALQKRKLSYP